MLRRVNPQYMARVVLDVPAGPFNKRTLVPLSKNLAMISFCFSVQGRFLIVRSNYILSL
jgi:hypothetical protein